MSADLRPVPTPAPDHPTIYEAIAAVMRDLRPVGKRGTNTEQRYKYRTVDDVYSALHGPLGQHGVFIVPRVLQRLQVTGLGKDSKGTRTSVEVEYDLFGPRGDKVTAGPWWGEALDYSDKSTNKALTASLKYLLFQLFCIAVEGDDDADATTPEPARPERPEQPPQQRGPGDRMGAFRTAMQWARRVAMAKDQAALQALWREASAAKIDAELLVPDPRNPDAQITTLALFRAAAQSLENSSGPLVVEVPDGEGPDPDPADPWADQPADQTDPYGDESQL